MIEKGAGYNDKLYLALFPLSHPSRRITQNLFHLLSSQASDLHHGLDPHPVSQSGIVAQRHFQHAHTSITPAMAARKSTSARSCSWGVTSGWLHVLSSRAKAD